MNPATLNPDANFSTGAVRSAAVAHLSFTSLPMIGLIAVARTAGEGAEKFGRYNYMLGFPEHDLLDHAIAHILMHVAGDRSEPHLPHAAWGLLAAIQAAALDPDLSLPHMLGPGLTMTQEMRDYITQHAPGLAERRRTPEAVKLADWSVDRLPEVKTLLSQRARLEEEAARFDRDAAWFARQSVPCADCQGDLGCEMVGCAVKAGIKYID